MKRTDFLRGIIGFLGLAALPQGIVIRQYQRIYYRALRGFRFYEGMGLMNGMKEGDLLPGMTEYMTSYIRILGHLRFWRKLLQRAG